ncbi:hypothetical protein GCM10018772_38140 [Streptomyces fumanus]|uniref:Uncharacterized protein n=1 Tax=Streptomyces fumanus TaxID=67302 RepID=A0A919E3M7_9ACTN|nr:hypothetical protein GCM10018772_38140 [Streptomyces fumanus]
MAASPRTIRLTQQGVPGARRAGGSPVRPAGSRASVIVTLSPAPPGGRVASARTDLRADAGTGPAHACSGPRGRVRRRTPPGGSRSGSAHRLTDTARMYSTCPVPHAG